MRGSLVVGVKEDMLPSAPSETGVSARMRTRSAAAPMAGDSMKPATATAEPANAICPLFRRMIRISTPPTIFYGPSYTQGFGIGSAPPFFVEAVARNTPDSHWLHDG